MRPELLKILACPKSKKELIVAPEEILQKANHLIQQKALSTIGGEAVREEITKALYQPQTHLLYPISGDIPILIYENGMVVE